MNAQREHYRISYCARDRPPVDANGVELQVIDLSGSGTCLVKSALFREEMLAIPVCIRFRDGVEFTTTTSFVREEADRVAVHFSPLIPLRIIFAEQRRLRRLYFPKTDCQGVPVPIDMPTSFLGSVIVSEPGTIQQGNNH